jgi:hypothetical protein
MVAHLMEDCDKARENMLNHVNKEQLHPQRRTGIEHTGQRGHTKKTYNKQDAPKTNQNHTKPQQNKMMMPKKKNDYTNSIHKKQL